MEEEKPRLEAVVFDLDDTLMPCKKYYVQMRTELFVWMSEVFEPMLSEEFGMKKGSLVRKAHSIQRKVEKEDVFTRDVYEIIDEYFNKDEDAGIAWSHLEGAIDMHYDNRQKEGPIERTKRLQGMVKSPPFLRLAFELFADTSPDSIPKLALAAMAHAFQLESLEDYHEFKKRGEQLSTRRVPQTCRKTYLQMCELLGTRPEWEHLYKAAEIGSHAFNITEELMPGAEEMLDYLKSLDARTALLTRGPKDKQDNVQWLKYNVTGLDRWIPEADVEIVTTKTPEHYVDLLGNTSPENALSIGNDYDSDLHPARMLGMHTIWIPLETWIMDSSERFDEECGQPFLVEEGVFGWRTEKGLYTFQVDSAERVPALLKEYFSR